MKRLIEDYSSPQWRSLVYAMVARLNAVMPENGPQLVYALRDGPCPDSVRSIAVCSVPDMENWGETRWFGKNQERALVTLNDARDTNPGLVCHELMHALTRRGDKPNSHPNTSCMWGTLDEPGPKDVELLRKAYAKKEKK